MSKVNPRKRPASEEDVRRAWDDGVLVGVSNATAIFLSVLVDKFDGAEKIGSVWSEIIKLTEEVRERRVSIGDLRCVLREEYGIEV